MWDAFFSILALIGGLGLFLYGMDVMGDSLKKLAGGKLEMILSKLTSNVFKGLLLGFGVTAIIQSSSATTVMLVGFVNSGIMHLGQTISIIMGANIGTTVTAWLLSLNGISDGAGNILKLFKPSSFTPILIAVGVIMTMVCKSDKKKNVASILIGFAVLMFGMDAMSDAMAFLKDSKTFKDILIMFQNPVLGVLAGTILTAIIQSSSASVGILQALSGTLAIPFSTAIPIILGQNIGTTITPILSAITGNTESKRVAMACLYIKIIGVVIVGGLFAVLQSIFSFSFMEPGVHVNELTIAFVHTAFNILSTIILVPFCKLIANLSIKTVKGKKNEKTSRFDILDDRFLDIPSFAVEKCRELMCEMAKEAEESVEDANKLLQKYDKELVRKVRESEDLVDIYEDRIGTYLVKLAGKNLSEADSRIVSELLHCIGDIERISDHAAGITKAVEELHEKQIAFSDSAQKELHVIANAVGEVMSLATTSFLTEDLEMAKRVEPLEQVIDRLKSKIKANHIVRLQQGYCSIEMGFILSDLLNNYVRISAHCSNVAVCLLEISNGTFGTHEYLSNMKNSEDDLSFKERYAYFKQKYIL
ncbi:MAG: Na/Pi cotransporter family protein [Clostridia bacterium]|nr:Na/Pi cotransporter family protein [Clostridia bacterium]